MASWQAILVFFLFAVGCSENRTQTDPQRRNITEVIFAPGTLEADDRYNIVAQTDGYLTDLRFEEGMLVSDGELMARIENEQNVIQADGASKLHQLSQQNVDPSAPALLEIHARIAAAEAKVKHDQHQLEKYKRLAASNSIARIEYDNAVLNLTNSQSSLNAARSQYSNQQLAARQQELVQRTAERINDVLGRQNVIRARTGGKVYSQQKVAGDYVRKGDVIATMANPDKIYVRLNVDERDLRKVKVGQPVAIKLNTDAVTVYNATVRHILPAFDQASRSFIVKAYFTEMPGFDIIGTQLEANIVVGTKRNALVIPSNYLSEGNRVLLKENNQLVSVNPGVVSGGWVEILGGLNDGQTIILRQQ